MSEAARAIVLSAVFLAALGAAAFSALAAEEAPEAEAVEPRAVVLETLPCFKCHSLEKYLATTGGGFSHELHAMQGLHCNQCHIVGGHTRPRLRGEACASCHNLSVFVYGGGGMGKVAFNHDAHGAMFSCDKCHPGIFPMKQGGSRMTMNPMYQGKLCGACHNGRVAFSAQDCTKCHQMG
ncbi:MAG: cytochrome c3 family protein [Nitrospirota bacterium]|jgi:c(7)-type cytochrome triheme protein